MSDYPKLTEMGIRNPDQIERYMVNGMSDYEVLRIFYRRRKGSLLPSSRTYKFDRVPRNLDTSGKPEKTNWVLETHPDLRAAISELKALVSDDEQKLDTKQQILDHIRLLEEDFALRTEYIKKLTKQL